MFAAMSSLLDIGEMLHEYALQNFVDFTSSPASITTLEDDKENTERVTVDAVASNYNVLYHLMSHHPKQRHLPKKDLIKGLQAADHAVDYKMSGARTNSLYWARDEAEKLIMLWSYVWTCAKRSKASRNARLQKLKYLLQDSADDDDEYPEVTAEDGPEDGAEEVDDEADGNQAPPEEVDDEADGNQAPLALEDGVMDLVSDGEVECSCGGGGRWKAQLKVNTVSGSYTLRSALGSNSPKTQTMTLWGTRRAMMMTRTYRRGLTATSKQNSSLIRLHIVKSSRTFQRHGQSRHQR